MHALAALLRGNLSISELVLRGNSITDEGARALAAVLAGPCALRVIDLRANFIGKTGLRAIAEALERCGACAAHVYLLCFFCVYCVCVAAYRCNRSYLVLSAAGKPPVLHHLLSYADCTAISHPKCATLDLLIAQPCTVGALCTAPTLLFD